MNNGEKVWAVVQRYYERDYNLCDHVVGLFATEQDALAVVAKKRVEFELEFRNGPGNIHRSHLPVPSWDDRGKEGYHANVVTIGELFYWED